MAGACYDMNEDIADLDQGQPNTQPRPDLAERYRPGNVTIACACVSLNQTIPLQIKPGAGLMQRLGMRLLTYLRRVAA